MPRATWILPRFPACAHSMASFSDRLDRLCVPACTMRLYLRAATTDIRPSQISCEIGFSTYTSLPAWQPHTVTSECQWFGVAVEIASMSLLSNSFRRSAYFSMRGGGFTCASASLDGLVVGCVVGRVVGLITRSSPMACL